MIAIVGHFLAGSPITHPDEKAPSTTGKIKRKDTASLPTHKGGGSLRLIMVVSSVQA
jgi:hypothetical protein